MQRRKYTSYPYITPTKSTGNGRFILGCILVLAISGSIAWALVKGAM